MEPGGESDWNNMLVELHAPISNFTHLKCDIPATSRDAMEFLKHSTHDAIPFLHGSRERDSDCFRINHIEPAAKPIVLRVLHDV